MRETRNEGGKKVTYDVETIEVVCPKCGVRRVGKSLVDVELARMNGNEPAYFASEHKLSALALGVCLPCRTA